MLKERLESIEDLMRHYDKDCAVIEILNLAYDYDLENYVANIISIDELDDLVQVRMNKGGWEGVACMFSRVNYLNDEYYFINEYENLEELTMGRLECIFDDLKRELEEELKEEI